MILSEGECMQVFMLAVTLESVMWAHAGACCHSLVISMKGRRGGHRGKTADGEKEGEKVRGQWRKKGNFQIYRGSRKLEFETALKNFSFTTVP